MSSLQDGIPRLSGSSTNVSHSSGQGGFTPSISASCSYATMPGMGLCLIRQRLQQMTEIRTSSDFGHLVLSNFLHCTGPNGLKARFISLVHLSFSRFRTSGFWRSTVLNQNNFCLYTRVSMVSIFCLFTFSIGCKNHKTLRQDIQFVKMHVLFQWCF